MKAVVINEYGDRSNLHVQEMPRPEPDGHDVLIRVFATGINPLDYKVREGVMKSFMPAKFPLVLGAECAGIVESVGVLAKGVQPGDRVVASLGPTGGGYAEYAIAQDKNVAKLPDEVSFGQAAAMVVGGLTALQSLRDLGQLRPGDRVLINGASGGVGTYAIQVARQLGAYITAVCSADNVPLVTQLGADRVIDYKLMDFTKDIEKYNVVFDAVGTSSLDECRDILTEEGVYVSTLPSAKRMLEGVTSIFTKQKSEIISMKFTKEDMDYLLKLATQGHLISVIDRAYSLEDIAAAHAYIETGRVKGKLVIAIADEARAEMQAELAGNRTRI